LQGQGGNTREEMNLGFVILIYCFKNFPSDNRLIVVMHYVTVLRIKLLGVSSQFPRSLGSEIQKHGVMVLID